MAVLYNSKQLLGMAEDQLDSAGSETNEYEMVCALRSIALSLLVLARSNDQRTSTT